MAEESDDSTTEKKGEIDLKDSPAAHERSKKKSLFSSLGKALRKRSKSKSKSLTDLTFNSVQNGRLKLTQNYLIDRSPSQDADGNNYFNEHDDRTSTCSTNAGSNRNSFSESVHTASIGSHSSQDVRLAELEEIDIKETDRNAFAGIPPGTTAAAIWKSGVCSFFSVEGEIVAGYGLIARDKSGTSDPYVKVKFQTKCVFKSKIVYRNLNPEWNERFHLAVDDINTELLFKVYDFDRLSYDDDMGEASINLGALEINKENEIKLALINRHGFQENLGKIIVKLTITPKTPNEKIEQLPVQLRNCLDIHGVGDSIHRLKKKIKVVATCREIEEECPYKEHSLEVDLKIYVEKVIRKYSKQEMC